MTKILPHTLLLILSVVATYAWITTPGLSKYNLQASALMFLVFFGVRSVCGREIFAVLESMISTIIILLIVSTTGGVVSPLFFLVYFLLFSVAIILEPVIPFVLSLALVPYFFFSSKWDGSITALTQLTSLPLITPFAILLGQEYLKVQEQKNLITRLATENQKISREENLIKKNTLLWITTILHNHVAAIIEAVENFRGDQDLEAIKKSARRLESLGEKLKEEVEK